MSNFKTGFVVGLVMFISFAAFYAGLQRQERYECYMWKFQAEEYTDFYLTQWQADQCAAHKIAVNAPIK